VVWTDIPRSKPQFQTLHTGTVVPIPEHWHSRLNLLISSDVIKMVCHHASVSQLTRCGKSLCYAVFLKVLMGAVSRSIVILSLPLITKSTQPHHCILGTIQILACIRPFRAKGTASTPKSISIGCHPC